MDCRIISFAPPPPGAAAVGNVYEADWTGERFKLKGEYPAWDRMRTPLQALVAEAEQLELHTVADGYRKQRINQISGFSVRDYLTNIYNGHAEATWNTPVQLDREGLALDRALRNEVNRICKRRTVFLVPDYWPATLLLSKAKNPAVEAVLQKIATELYARLSSGTGVSDIGFLRLRRPAKKRVKDVPKNQQLDDPDDPGLMRSIIKRLLSLASKDLSIGISAEGGFAGGANVPEGPILFDGPTGSGKSLAAELLALNLGKNVIHVNVAGLTESILEGQMRGYMEGSFTGATKSEDGWFAKADGQVLFLDEFQNASLASQTQLLDLLDPFSDDVYVNPIGASSRRRYTVKVVIAVNKPVQDLLATGALREDLYYRIRKVVKFRPLAEALMTRDTPGERARMIRRLALLYRWKSSPFWQDPDPARGLHVQLGFPALFPEMDDDAVDLIAASPWKGNFRELERVITDIHWKNDCRDSSSIGIEEVQFELANAARWPDGGSRPALWDHEQATAAGSAYGISDLFSGLCSGKMQIAASDAVSWDRAYLEMIQDLFLRNRFNIERTVTALKPTRINLGSRQSLRTFLKENFDLLRPEVRMHEKINRFLGGQYPEDIPPP